MDVCLLGYPTRKSKTEAILEPDAAVKPSQRLGFFPSSDSYGALSGCLGVHASRCPVHSVVGGGGGGGGDGDCDDGGRGGGDDTDIVMLMKLLMVMLVVV